MNNRCLVAVASVLMIACAIVPCLNGLDAQSNVVEPGMIVYVQDGSHYTATDEYPVNYYKPYYEHLWPWDPDYEYEEYTLTANVVIDP